MSAVLQRDNGTPLFAGISHASALTSMTTSGGKNPGAPRAVSLIEPRQALLKEPLAPETHDLASSVQTFGDFLVAVAFISQEDDLCALNQNIR